MPSFEELLRTTLLGADDEFRTAEEDLNREVSEAALAVQRLTAGRFSLRLVREGRSDLFLYTLVLQQRDRPPRGLMTFSLPPAGYPILVARDAKSFDEPATTSRREAKDRAELKALFSELAADRGSPLVVALAFALRQGTKGSEDGGRETAENSGEQQVQTRGP